MSVFKKTKCVLALLLALVLAVSGLSACGTEEKTALSCEGTEFTEAMYAYWYKQLKKYYMDSYSDIQDNESFWNTTVPYLDMTYGEFVDEKIRTQIDYYLAGNVLFKQYKLKMPASVEEGIDEEIEDGVNAFGSRSDYDKYLKGQYGIDSKTLRTIKLMEQKFYLVYDYLYNSETGIDLASDAEIDAYYQENYAHIKYYMVLKNFEYRVDSEGNRVVDASGNYIQDALTDAEKQERATYATDAFHAIAGGADIDGYIKKDYPDILTSAPNGYYVLQHEYYGYLFTATVINATFDMDVGDTVLCENEDAYFIVQRLPLPDKAYEGSDKAQFTDIGSYAINEKFEARFADVIKLIEHNTEVCNKYSVKSVS